MLRTSPHFALVLLILLSCSVTGFQAKAQRPATGGAAPLSEEDGGVSPVVFIVGGAAVVTASYVLVKSKGAKLPVSEHLPEYLLAHNILPNTAAIKLMYSLNPSLNNIEEIRTNKKLKMPDFPDLDQSISKDAGDFAASLSSELGAQVDRFGKSRASLEKLAPPMTSAQNMARIKTIVTQVNQDLSSSNQSGNANNAVIDQMVFDLLSTFNQTLNQVIADKNADEAQITLMQNIADNLSELSNDVKILSRMGQASPRSIDRELHDGWNYLASAGQPNYLIEQTSLPKENTTEASILIEEGLLKPFAFAVYKFNSAGELITKGPEVEGKYKVKYALPALKDIPNAYHSLRDPATYATANFPPAKIFIVVEDFSGNPVSIQDQLVDFKVVFNNPQLINQDKKIVVPLYITK